MTCTEKIYSEEYLDYLVEHVGDDERILEWYGVDCFQIASDRYAAVYLPKTRISYETMVQAYQIPHCYGLLSSDQLLDEIGVARVQRQPTLSLYGQGVMVGFIDTGAGVCFLV